MIELETEALTLPTNVGEMDAADFDAQVAYNDDPPAFDERTVQQMDALFDVFRAEEGDKEAERRLFKQPLLARFMSPEIRKDEAAREKSLGVVASTMAGVEPWMAFRRLKKNGLEGVDETGSWNRSDYARGVTALLRNAYKKDKAERESQRKVRESTENYLPDDV